MRIALAGGGTGGHVVPGLHLLEHLSAHGQRPADVLWFQAGRPIEERVLAGARHLLGELELERVVLELEPESGGAPGWLRVVARTPLAMRRARNALARHGSEVLLGLGGYTALPAVLAARTLGIPVLLLEINAVSGKATRSLGGLAERIVHAWPESRASESRVPGSHAPGAPARRGARHACFGPPLAPAFARPRATRAESAAARARLGFDGARPLLLVLGGSQGAAPLNRFVREACAELAAAGLQVLHQTGPGRLAESAESPRSSGHAASALGTAPYRAFEYLDDVQLALDAATLVLCRGGASTLAEVAARCRAALVVPYPHHRDRHQERNARALGEGVRVVPEHELGATLVPELVRLSGAAGGLERERMERALESAVPRDGVARLADELLQVASRFRTKASSPPV